MGFRPILDPFRPNLEEHPRAFILEHIGTSHPRGPGGCE